MKSFFTSLILFFCISIMVGQGLNWQHTDGPEGGGTTLKWNDDQYGFFSDYFFTYRTEDGLNWKKIYSGQIWPVDFNDDMMVGQFETGYRYTIKPINLKVSYDHGLTWAEIPAPKVPGQLIVKIAVTKAAIYCSYQDSLQFSYALIKTTDLGKNWTKVAVPKEYFNDFWKADDKIYIHSNNNIYRSDSPADDWTKVAGSFPYDVAFRSLLNTTSYIYLFTDQNIRRFDKAKAIWEVFDNPDKVDNAVEIEQKLYTITRNAALMSSNDWGATWQFIQNTPSSAVFEPIKVKDVALFSLYGRGVFGYDPLTGNFNNHSKGLYSGTSHKLLSDAQYLYAKSGNGLFRYHLQNQSWDSAPVFTRQAFKDQYQVNQKYICYSQEYNDTVNLSSDHGNTFERLILPKAKSKFLFWSTTLLDSNLYYVNWRESFRYEFKTKQWYPMNELQTTGALVPSLRYGGQLYTLSMDNVTKLRALYRGSEANPIQSPVQLPVDFTPSTIFTDGSRFFVYGSIGSNNLVYMSTNTTNWVEAVGLSANNIDYENSTILSQGNELVLLNVSSRDRYISNDGGLTWTKKLAIDPFGAFALVGNDVYAGGFGNGVFTLKKDALFNSLNTGVEDLTESLLSDQVVIAPNPNTGYCTITLKSPTAGIQSIEIYDLDGRLQFFKELDGKAGSAELWLQNLNNGVHFIKVKTENEQYLSKLVIQK